MGYFAGGLGHMSVTFKNINLDASDNICSAAPRGINLYFS